MSKYEDEVRQSLRRQLRSSNLREIANTESLFFSLARSFPVVGSKIEWSAIPGAVVRTASGGPEQVDQFISFFNEVVEEFYLSGPVFYAGDGPANIALQGSLTDMRRILGVLLEIPQHHYFIEPNCRWCICFTFEGDMAFAKRRENRGGTSI